jgi:hypothetical protein
MKWICPSDYRAHDRIMVTYTKCNKTLEELEISYTGDMTEVVSLFNKYENLKDREILYILIRKFVKGIIHRGKASY